MKERANLLWGTIRTEEIMFITPCMYEWIHLVDINISILANKIVEWANFWFGYFYRLLWVILLLFLMTLTLMTRFLAVSNQPQAPIFIKPVPENYFLADALQHGIQTKQLNESLSTQNIGLVEEESSVCSQPISKVGFMKTHKTASSTVQNILMRYGMNSDWNFVMYSAGSHLGPPSNQYSLNRPFSSSWLRDVPWHDMAQEQGYNILAFHTKWDQGEVERVLGDGAKYITILRDPVDEFESLYNCNIYWAIGNFDLFHSN